MSRRILRSVLAILFGWAVIAGGSMTTMVSIALFNPGSSGPGSEFATGRLMVTLLVSLIWSLIGGYVTGVVARGSEIKHAVGLVLFCAAISVWSVSRYKGPTQVPGWFTVAGYVLGFSAILLGGWLRMKQAVVLRRMPQSVTGTIDSLRLSVAVTVDQFRFAAALASSGLTYFVAMFLGYIVCGIGVLGIERLVDLKPYAGALVGVMLIVCFILPFVPAGRVFRRIMTVDTSLIKGTA